MCVEHIPSPAAAAKLKVQQTYTGPTDSTLTEYMVECDREVNIGFVKGILRDHSSDSALNFHKIRDFCIFVMILDV